MFRLLPCFKILRLENTQFIMSSTRYSTSKIKQRYYAEILSSNKCCPMQCCIHNSVVQICGVRGSFEIACLCYCKIAPWLFIRPTGRVFVEVNNAARQRKGRKANIRNVSSVMILLAGVKRESVSFSFSFPAWFQRYRRYFFQTKQNFGLVEEVHEQEWYRSRTLWCIQLYHGVGISAYL